MPARNLRVVAPFAREDDVEALALAKLASSGLTRKDAEALGISWLSADAVKTLDAGHWFLPGLLLKYFNPWKPGEALKPRPNWDDFYRLRALRDPVPMPDRFAKYIQPGGSGTCAYFPRIMDWLKILNDPAVPLIITEGELKAAKACLEGFPTIGLGGVNSYKAVRQGFTFLPELARITWPKRPVYVIFDSDARDNPNVSAALWDLAEELQRRGALPMTVPLPTEGEKVGLDDFLLKEGAKGLRLQMEDADHLTLAESLWKMNERYCYINKTGVVVKKQTGDVYKPEAVGSHITTDDYMENYLQPNGVVSRRRVNAGAAWIRWPLRATAEHVEYIPGEQPRAIVPDVNGELVYNLWPGWGAEPVKGDVSLFVKLIDHLFTGAEPEAKHYFWQWMAYPIARPGTKLFSGAVLHSVGQGLGKSLVGLTLGKVYGSNFALVTQENMEGAFNNWANGRQMILVDDVTNSDRRRDIDRLKAMITRETLWLNVKHVPEYSVRDCIAYLFSSNHQDVLLLDEQDRRFFIHEIRVAPLPRTFYDKYDKWYRTPEAASALHYHMKHDVDLTGFNPNAPPPMTAAKAAMIRLARTDVETWVRDMIAEPAEFLKIGELPMRGDLFTLAELRAAYSSRTGRDPEISQIGFARKLAAGGLKMVNNGENLYVTGRPLARYYAIRRAEHWLKQPIDAVKRHLGEAAAEARLRKV